MVVDLRSDTVTKPTPDMLAAMWAAPVGDDVFEEDISINALQEKAAAMFGHEAGLFCASGTQTNQIAIKVHTQPGDEVICDALAHIYNYEGGGIAFNSGASVRLLQGRNGIIEAAQIPTAIQPDNVHHPRTSLVAIENTCNRGGGGYYSLENLKAIHQTCTDYKLPLHLDGARLFNALVASGQHPQDIGPLFSSISICLSKGLGAPVGSILLGSHAFIRQAKRIRKVMGGGMRQAGYLAAAGSYALDHHVDRLKSDHEAAQELANAIQSLPYVEELLPVHTNILVFRLPNQSVADALLQHLLSHDIKVVPFGTAALRMVTHLDITPAMIAHTIKALRHFTP